MAYIDFISSLHKKSSRDYIGRVNEMPKAQAAAVAKRFGREYWDGDRKFGYGGYAYDGRWRPVAEKIAAHYKLQAGSRVLDVGCGKAFLLFELTQVVPGLEIRGMDISKYALDHAPEVIRSVLREGNARELPYENHSFDLVISINTLHNLLCYDLDRALGEIVRVTRKDAYITVESYRNETEKMNLLYWQLTCEMFCTPEEWSWWFDRTGYKGDHSFIYFE